jgi:hypothetical protein
MMMTSHHCHHHYRLRPIVNLNIITKMYNRLLSYLPIVFFTTL